jgi:hypothetical protein
MPQQSSSAPHHWPKLEQYSHWRVWLTRLCTLQMTSGGFSRGGLKLAADSEKPSCHSLQEKRIGAPPSTSIIVPWQHWLSAEQPLVLPRGMQLLQV